MSTKLTTPATDPTGYHWPRRFKPGAKLHPYLADRCRELVSHNFVEYTLYTILLALRQVISKTGMFDRNNPTVITCDKELESAIGMKALHVTEVR